MKKIILSLFILSTLALTSSADESEFPYIKPVAVEDAPQIDAVQSAPLDQDGDGVLDKEDKCPNTAAGEKVNALGCLLLKDADKDGVSDKDDQCPATIAGASVDTKGCELDSDNDGIKDSKDNCPNTSADFLVDGFGCPQTATLSVTFGPNKYNVTKNLIKQLEEFASFLKDNNGYQVVIYGYTDSLGNAKVNKKLSQKRANSVKEALTRYGIKSTRLTAVGKGEENPIASNTDKEGRAQNRRIEVELIE